MQYLNTNRVRMRYNFKKCSSTTWKPFIYHTFNLGCCTVSAYSPSFLFQFAITPPISTVAEQSFATALSSPGKVFFIFACVFFTKFCCRASSFYVSYYIPFSFPLLLFEANLKGAKSTRPAPFTERLVMVGFGCTVLS